MEDFHMAEFRDIDGEEIGLFGIIDSHGGPVVGKHVQHHLFDNILNEGGVHLDPAGATRDGYLLTDRNVLEGSLEGGCSAVTAMLVDHGSRLIVANVGDARAILAKNGRAVQLSVDHDPGSPTERASVERRGGMVTQIPGDYWRVDGLLSVARAFGDKSLKQHMSARPDLADHVVDLSCEFLILGSNGLWAVFTNQEVVDIVHRVKDPRLAAQELVSEARNRHSEDDISCLVIQFREL
jgi:protein phosphatase 1L